MWKSLEEARERAGQNLIDSVDCHVFGECYQRILICIFLLAWLPLCAIIWLLTTAILTLRGTKKNDKQE